MKKLNKKQEKKVNAGRYTAGERKLLIDDLLGNELTSGSYEIKGSEVRVNTKGDDTVVG